MLLLCQDEHVRIQSRNQEREGRVSVRAVERSTGHLLISTTGSLGKTIRSAEHTWFNGRLAGHTVLFG